MGSSYSFIRPFPAQRSFSAMLFLFARPGQFSGSYRYRPDRFQRHAVTVRPEKSGPVAVPWSGLCRISLQALLVVALARLFRGRSFHRQHALRHRKSAHPSPASPSVIPAGDPPGSWPGIQGQQPTRALLSSAAAGPLRGSIRIKPLRQGLGEAALAPGGCRIGGRALYHKWRTVHQIPPRYAAPAPGARPVQLLQLHARNADGIGRRAKGAKDAQAGIAAQPGGRPWPTNPAVYFGRSPTPPTGGKASMPRTASGSKLRVKPLAFSSPPSRSAGHAEFLTKSFRIRAITFSEIVSSCSIPASPFYLL